MNKIIYGDALKELSMLPSESVDLTCTDPPYNLGKDYGPWSSDKRPWPGYWAWFKDVFTEVHRVMKDGYLYISHSDKGAFTAKPILDHIGFDYIQTIIWWAKNGHSQGLNTRSWSYRHETILFLQKGRPRNLIHSQKGMWFQSVIDIPRPQRNYKESRWHPTQKPVKLYETLLCRTPGDVVLDPFLGSGSVAVASKVLGKSCIGIEINPEYVKGINQRLSQKVMFTDP